MVAVVVPSPAWSEVLEATSRTICAPMFSNLFSSSISLTTVTPSLVRNARQALTDRVRLVPNHELLLQRRNRRFDVLELSCPHLQHLPRHRACRSSPPFPR